MEFNVMTACILIAAIWSVFCRINFLKPGKTKPRVFYQYAALGLGLAGGLLLVEPYAKTAMAAGILVFLLAGSHRWKFGAPDDTKKANPLDPILWNHVSGGKSER